jgi:hypothetical protein
MSPGSMYTFSPSTAVNPRLPSTMNLKAKARCRCAGAVSPGLISCNPP